MSIPAYVMCRSHALCYRVGSYKTHSESCNCKPKNVAAVNTPLETSYGNKNPKKVWTKTQNINSLKNSNF